MGAEGLLLDGVQMRNALSNVSDNIERALSDMANHTEHAIELSRAEHERQLQNVRHRPKPAFDSPTPVAPANGIHIPSPQPPSSRGAGLFRNFTPTIHSPTGAARPARRALLGDPWLRLWPPRSDSGRPAGCGAVARTRTARAPVHGSPRDATASLPFHCRFTQHHDAPVRRCTQN